MKDADGKDIEVFTAEEVKAQNDAALAEYQKEHPDQSADIKTANDAKVAAETALAAALAAGGEDTKDENIKNLRVAVATANTKADAIQKEALDAISALKNAPTQEYKSELVEAVARGDKTLKEKIDIRYAELSGMPEGNKAEVRLRMEAAVKLAVDNYRPGMLDGATGMGTRGSGGMPRPGGTEAHPNENAAAIANALGISDETAKKYAPLPGQPGYQA